MSQARKSNVYEATMAGWKLSELCAGTTARWELAGSIRRGRPFVGDVEHVVVPLVKEVPGRDLFATPERTNLLWSRLDDLLERGLVTKAVYGDHQRSRWAQKMRGLMFMGFKHEIYTTPLDNWGATLLIRTGPAEYARRFVTELKRRGYEHRDGRAWPVGRKWSVSVSDERTAHALAAMPYRKPTQRETA